TAVAQQSDGALTRGGASLDIPLFDRARAILGVLTILCLAWLMSTNRAKIPWRVLFWGLT
ncbi:MAG: hypothetical protein GWN71_41025, partial [Gammaproteobacteria bacterium]|nr:hypothetical protein [Gammaproteobacteria bacterium]